MIRLFNAPGAAPSAIADSGRGARTPACRVRTHANTILTGPPRSVHTSVNTARRRACVPGGGATLILLLFQTLAGAEPADAIYTARYVVTMNARRDLIDNGAV